MAACSDRLPLMDKPWGYSASRGAAVDLGRPVVAPHPPRSGIIDRNACDAEPGALLYWWNGIAAPNPTSMERWPAARDIWAHAFAWRSPFLSQSHVWSCSSPEVASYEARSTEPRGASR